MSTTRTAALIRVGARSQPRYKARLPSATTRRASLRVPTKIMDWNSTLPRTSPIATKVATRVFYSNEKFRPEGHGASPAASNEASSNSRDRIQAGAPKRKPPQGSVPPSGSEGRQTTGQRRPPHTRRRTTQRKKPRDPDRKELGGNSKRSMSDPQTAGGDRQEVVPQQVIRG